MNSNYHFGTLKYPLIQSAEDRRKERHRFWLRLCHAVILVSTDRTSAPKKINGKALIRAQRFRPLRSKERKKNSMVFGRLYYAYNIVYLCRSLPEQQMKLGAIFSSVKRWAPIKNQVLLKSLYLAYEKYVIKNVVVLFLRFCY